MKEGCLMKVDVVNSSKMAPQPDQKPAASVNIAQSAKNAQTEPVETKFPPRLVKAVIKLNKEAEALNREVRFAIYDGTHRIMIEVLDKQNNQVVATFPPKQILKMAEAFEQDAANEQNISKKEV
jgi:flagellar protein FlaG